jgi:hypothetical protein
MRITKVNSKEVAQWLLQCDHEDFDGPMDLISEHYMDLDKAYRQWLKSRKNPEKYGKPGSLQMTVLTRHLVQHLNKKARVWLEEKIAFSKKGCE